MSEIRSVANSAMVRYAKLDWLVMVSMAMPGFPVLYCISFVGYITHDRNMLAMGACVFYGCSCWFRVVKGPFVNQYVLRGCIWMWCCR